MPKRDGMQMVEKQPRNFFRFFDSIIPWLDQRH